MVVIRYLFKELKCFMEIGTLVGSVEEGPSPL